MVKCDTRTTHTIPKTSEQVAGWGKCNGCPDWPGIWGPCKRGFQPREYDVDGKIVRLRKGCGKK